MKFLIMQSSAASRCVLTFHHFLFNGSFRQTVNGLHAVGQNVSAFEVEIYLSNIWVRTDGRIFRTSFPPSFLLAKRPANDSQYEPRLTWGLWCARNSQLGFTCPAWTPFT